MEMEHETLTILTGRCELICLQSKGDRKSGSPFDSTRLKIFRAHVHGTTEGVLLLKLKNGEDSRLTLEMDSSHKNDILLRSFGGKNREDLQSITTMHAPRISHDVISEKS